MLKYIISVLTLFFLNLSVLADQVVSETEIKIGMHTDISCPV